MDNVAPLLGKPDCPYCGGVGFLRVDVPVGHQKFGRLEPCVCRANEIAENARQRLYEMSNLERLSHLTFANFNSSGNPKAEFVSPQEVASLRDAPTLRNILQRLSRAGYCSKVRTDAARRISRRQSQMNAFSAASPRCSSRFLIYSIHFALHTPTLKQLLKNALKRSAQQTC